MKIQALDGSYFFAVSTKSRDGDVSGLHYNSRVGVRSDMWVVKLTADGKLSVPSAVTSRKELLVEAANEVSAFPNPFSRQTTIQFTALVSGETTVDLYNANNRKIRTVFNGTVTAGQLCTVNVEGATLPKGMYFYLINNNKNRLSGRLVKN
jgi:hypothetical protein